MSPEEVREALELELATWAEILKTAKTPALKEEANRGFESCSRQLSRVARMNAAEQS